MMFTTHLIFSFLIILLIYKIFPQHYSLAGLILHTGFAVFPDIDHSKSIVGRRLKIIGWVSKHRRFFHSLLFIGLVIALIYPFVQNDMLLIFIFLGFLSHIFLDGLTPAGITFLYPFSKKRFKGPIRSGSVSEWLFLVIILMLIFFVFLLL